MSDIKGDVFRRLARQGRRDSKGACVMSDPAAVERSNVIDLASRRPPVTYAVDVTDFWDGRMSVHVRDVRDDAGVRRTIAVALREAADVLERGALAG